MKVLGTASDRESLDPLLAKSPDVILLDIDLGSESSLDFLPKLAANTDARILMITGVRESAVHEEAILKGARGVLMKDEGAAVILKAIEKVHEGEIWMDSQSLSRVLDRMNVAERQRKARGEDEGPVSELTKREIEIIRALVTFEASTNNDIADKLNISTSTLKNHLTTIYSKLDVKNRVHLIKYALTHNLAGPPS